MQFFVGLKEFDPDPVFDPSLFAEIRKRVGAKIFDELNAKLIESTSKPACREARKEDEKHNAKGEGRKQDNADPKPDNKEKLQMDATVADQYITYPTDSKVLNSSRKQCEK